MHEIRLLELFSGIHRKLLRRIKPFMQQEGLSTTEALVLWKVHRRGEYRVTCLAAEIGVPPSTLTGILDRLTSRGLLERAADPGDRRAVVVRSTERLAELIRHTTRETAKRLSGVFRRLPPERMERVMADLAEILEILDREEAGEEGGAE